MSIPSLVVAGSEHDYPGKFTQVKESVSQLSCKNEPFSDLTRRQVLVPVLSPLFESNETLFEKARELLTIYYDSWDHGAKILAVKLPFEFDPKNYLPEYSNLPRFKGMIDGLINVGGSVLALGVKTSSTRLSALGLVKEAQLTEYSLGSASLGFQPDKYRLDALITTSNPDLVTDETERGEHHQLWFLKMVSRIWKAIGASIFYPRPDWYCHNCPWQTYCRDW